MKVIWNLSLSFILFLTAIFVGWNTFVEKPGNPITKMEAAKIQQNKYQGKKVILFVIDSLMANKIDKGIKNKELPTFEALIRKGYYARNMVSTFPTMSVTIDSSLVTGSTPDQHLIPGLTWYNASEKRIVNYGTGPIEIMKSGYNQVLNQSIIHLNQNHLSKDVTTIFEDLSQKNRTSGSINGLIYRGDHQHPLTFPLWLSSITSLPHQVNVQGPNYLSFGVFTHPLSTEEKKTKLDKRFGFNNTFSLSNVAQLIKTNQQPDFLLVYLPDMDQQIHEYGPEHQKSIKTLDSQLGIFFDQLGTLDKALNDNIIILMGDSGQAKIHNNRREAVISLPELLHPYSTIATGTPLQATDIVLAINERMAFIYPLNQKITNDDLIHQLQKDTRIDLIVWKEKEWIHVIRKNEQLRFQPGNQYIDEFNETWNIEGNLNALDIIVDKQHQRIQYDQYPNALRRLSASLHSHPGKYMIVTSKIGNEFTGGDSPLHINGGGHGSLDKSDSLIPLIILGTEERPRFLKIEEMKKYILQLYQ